MRLQCRRPGVLSGQGNVEDRTVPAGLDEVVDKIQNNPEFKENLGTSAMCAGTACILKAAADDDQHSMSSFYVRAADESQMDGLARCA